MRTVTFSDEKIAKLVNDNFVSTWVNRNPKFHNCDLSQERRIFTSSYECYATKNFCTFFVTPDLEVLHYFSGYYNPEFFRHEVAFVQDLAKQVLDGHGKFKRDGLAAYRLAHEKHAAKHKADGKAVTKIKASKEISGDWNGRKENLAEGLNYLDRVHTAIQKYSVRKARPYQLEEVIRNYMGGNEFTEE